MSALESNLSDGKYGYDMVVSTTQASINATMKMYLNKNQGKEFIKAYVYNPDAKEGEKDYKEVEFSTLTEALGFDPFSVPKGTPFSDDKIKKMLDQKFMFAFKTKLGLPDPSKFPVGSLPPVVEFNRGSSMVSYNLFCEEFQIIDLQPGGYSDGTWTNINQDNDGAPWVTSFIVNIDLRTDNDENAFSKLPKEVQDKVKNLCPDTMFSIEQLLLDMNTRQMQTAPTISRIDDRSKAKYYLINDYLNVYIKEVFPEDDYIMGFTIKPHTAPQGKSSIIPTDLNLEVSPFTKNKADYNLYTLNYLVMTNDNSMPAPVPFDWNWVDKDQVTDYHGAMCIKKNIFVNFLRSILSPSLQNISLVPYASINCSWPASVKYSWGVNREQSPQNYNVVNDGSSHVLSFSFTKEASDSDDIAPWPLWGNISLKYSVTSDVYLEGNIIKSVTRGIARPHINIEGGVTEGNFVNYLVTNSYAISVDAQGNLSVSMVDGHPIFEDQSEKPDPDGWSKFVTLGDIDNLIDHIVNSIKGWFQQFLTGHDNQILAMLNGSDTWVFPGGRTFIFKDAQFSKHQDFFSYITYTDPGMEISEHLKY
jgi:hypothetical protein